jgi:hypothetical protein
MRVKTGVFRGLVLAITVLPALALVPEAATSQGLTPEQVVSLRSVTAVAMSPDGQWVAYTATRPRDEVETRAPAFSELWVVPAAGGEPRLIVGQPHTAADPQWSPDGQTLTFAANLPQHDGRQVYGVSPTGGEPRPLTRSPRGVAAYRYSPDGGSLAYTESVPQPEAITQRRAAGNDVIVASEPGTFMRLFVQPVGGEPHPVTPSDRGSERVSWITWGGYWSGSSGTLSRGSLRSQAGSAFGLAGGGSGGWDGVGQLQALEGDAAAAAEDLDAGVLRFGQGVGEGGVDGAGGFHAVCVVALEDEQDGRLPTVLPGQVGQLPDVAGAAGGDRVGEEGDAVLDQGHALDFQRQLPDITGEEEVDAGAVEGPFRPLQ